MLHKNLKAEELQKFMRKHRLSECFVVDGMTFRDKGNAEAHCKKNKIDGGKIVTVAREEDPDQKQKIKSEKAKAE